MGTGFFWSEGAAAPQRHIGEIFEILMCSEWVLFVTLSAIGESMGGKVVPKGSKKVSKHIGFIDQAIEIAENTLVL